MASGLKRILSDLIDLKPVPGPRLDGWGGLSPQQEYCAVRLDYEAKKWERVEARESRAEQIERACSGSGQTQT